MQVSWHDAAIADSAEAAEYYDARQAGRGLKFSQALRLAVAAILDAPDGYEVVFGRVRRFIVDGYPYGVFYRLSGDVIRIIAVKHHSRDPKFGLRRR
jgi:plasmid stabilization system protein ParE